MQQPIDASGMILVSISNVITEVLDKHLRIEISDKNFE